MNLKVTCLEAAGHSAVAWPQRSAIRNATLGQVVRRDGNRDDVARKDANEILANLARDVRDDLEAILELDAELRVSECLNNFSLCLNQFLFRHTCSLLDLFRKLLPGGQNWPGAALVIVHFFVNSVPANSEQRISEPQSEPAGTGAVYVHGDWF